MDSREKKQTPFFKSVQISKEKKEKFFKVHKGSLKCDNQKKFFVLKFFEIYVHLYIFWLCNQFLKAYIP